MTSDGARDLARAVRGLADRLPERLGPLARVAYNYRWSWTPGGEELFRSLDPMRFERCRGNPVRLLYQLPAKVLEDAARDDDFLVAAAELQATIADDLFAPSLSRGAVTAEHPVAFVCAEFGIHRSLPICQGGLGILAGDVLKGASDLRLPMVGVGILYSQGNFHQRLDTTGWQHDYWIEVEPDYLPAALVTDEDGAPLVVELQIRGRTVRVQVWRVQVGRVALYLLDANREDNGVDERWITARLYVGDRTVRLEQYALLGVGGITVLEALGIEPSVVHINEGHGAFAPLALAAREVALGATREEALARARQKTVFTTHTPVAAGNETHDPETVLEVLGDLVEPDVLNQLGATEDGEIGMTSLGLRLSRRATAVSRVHGEVSRHMWRSLYDVKREEDVPIGHVTNGVHDATWMAAPMRGASRAPPRRGMARARGRPGDVGGRRRHLGRGSLGDPDGAPRELLRLPPRGGRGIATRPLRGPLGGGRGGGRVRSRAPDARLRATGRRRTSASTCCCAIPIGSSRCSRSRTRCSS